MTRAAAAALVLLVLAGCSGPAPRPAPRPAPEPVVEDTEASVAETCAVLYDPRHSPVAGAQVTLPYVVAGTDTPASRAATAEVQALLGAVERDGSPVFSRSVQALRRLYSSALGGVPVTPAQVREVVVHIDALCGAEAADGAGWAAWPN